MVDADKENQTLIMKDEVPLSYRNIAKLSFQLGITSFGGPDEHIKLIKDAIVVQNNHLNEDRNRSLINIGLYSNHRSSGINNNNTNISIE